MTAKKRPQNVIDWAAAKTLYVNDTTLTLQALADRFGVTLGAAKIRAAREDWTRLRADRARLLLQTATQKNIEEAAQELSKWNEQDLMIAKALRAQVGRKLKKTAKQQDENDDHTMDSRELRAIALVAQTAQQIARLALGASTENSAQPTVEPIDNMFTDADLEVLNDAEIAEFRRIVGKTLDAARQRSQQASSSTSGVSIQ